MPEAAVAAWLAFGVVCVGWRFLHQVRTTGDHGLRPLTSDSGPAGWLASGVLVLSFTASGLLPLLELFGVLTRTTAPRGQVIAGLGVMAAGLAITSASQFQMGASWRVGVRRGEHTALVTRGLFARVRNPIYSGVVLSALGAAIIVPRAGMFLALLGAAAGVTIQTRAVEEPHLLAVHGGAYAGYARRVGRFVPGLGRLRGGGEDR